VVLEERNDDLLGAGAKQGREGGRRGGRGAGEAGVGEVGTGEVRAGGAVAGQRFLGSSLAGIRERAGKGRGDWDGAGARGQAV